MQAMAMGEGAVGNATEANAFALDVHVQQPQPQPQPLQQRQQQQQHTTMSTSSNETLPPNTTVSAFAVRRCGHPTTQTSEPPSISDTIWKDYLLSIIICQRPALDCVSK